MVLVVAHATAALGLLWMHAINTRIVLEFTVMSKANLRPEDVHPTIPTEALSNLRSAVSLMFI